MRRLPRLRSASGLSALPRASNASQLAPAARMRHDLSAAKSSPLRPCCQALSVKQLVPQRAYSNSAPRNAEDDAETAVTTQPHGGQSLSDSAEARPSIRIPGRIVDAPKPDEVTDLSYVPAESGAVLEEVGGLKGYWEDDSRWDASFVPVGFGPRDKIADPALLEVLTRRAVIEALAVRDSGSGLATNPGLSGLWSRGNVDDASAALGIQITVADDGSATLAGDVDRVVSGLSGHSDAEAASAGEASMNVAEAKELISTWDHSWKGISLADNGLKFAVVKRIQQLTSHIIPSVKLSAIFTVKTLLAVLVKPPKPKKLAEEIETRGELEALANVSVHDRRVTRVDKHKAVGRWKVIVKELEKRDLPVLGTGGYGRYVEKEWLRAGELALRHAKDEKARAKRRERGR